MHGCPSDEHSSDAFGRIGFTSMESLLARSDPGGVELNATLKTAMEGLLRQKDTEKKKREFGDDLILFESSSEEARRPPRDEAKKEETPDKKNASVNVEELSCDLSAEDGSKQEWSFTLYDFDGKGRITKEDFTSLVTTVYNMLGSSIQSTGNSNKTLRLKLTVSPDRTGAEELGCSRPDGSKPRRFSKSRSAGRPRSHSRKHHQPKQLSKFHVSDFSTLEERGCKCDQPSPHPPPQQQPQQQPQSPSPQQQQQPSPGADSEKKSSRKKSSSHTKTGGSSRQRVVRESGERRYIYMDVAGVDNEVASPIRPHGAGHGAVQSSQSTPEKTLIDKKSREKTSECKYCQGEATILHRRSRSYDVENRFEAQSSLLALKLSRIGIKGEWYEKRRNCLDEATMQKVSRWLEHRSLLDEEPKKHATGSNQYHIHHHHHYHYHYAQT